MMDATTTEVYRTGDPDAPPSACEWIEVRLLGEPFYLSREAIAALLRQTVEALGGEVEEVRNCALCDHHKYTEDRGREETYCNASRDVTPEDMKGETLPGRCPLRGRGPRLVVAKESP